jgi:3-isopropylmalate/(R)-2-methylmalate dehydratase small subunit
LRDILPTFGIGNFSDPNCAEPDFNHPDFDHPDFNDPNFDDPDFNRPGSEKFAMVAGNTSGAEVLSFRGVVSAAPEALRHPKPALHPESPLHREYGFHGARLAGGRTMKPFTLHRGRVAPLDRVNVDTDQIIPKQFLKRIERTGFGQFVFYDWRFGADGKKHAGFVLDEPRYQGASILVAGRNFGCGSSREHAVWALADFGFRAVISSSFADIFANNSAKNGFLAVPLSQRDAAELMQRAQEIDDFQVTIDLEKCEVRDDQDFRAKFPIDEFVRHCLLHGLDDIGLTLQHEAEIEAYEARHPPPAELRVG